MRVVRRDFARTHAVQGLFSGVRSPRFLTLNRVARPTRVARLRRCCCLGLCPRRFRARAPIFWVLGSDGHRTFPFPTTSVANGSARSAQKNRRSVLLPRTLRLESI